MIRLQVFFDMLKKLRNFRLKIRRHRQQRKIDLEKNVLSCAQKQRTLRMLDCWLVNRYKCTLRLEFWLKNLHHYWLRNTEFPANTTVLIIDCCYQFKNMEKTGIVKRKINCSIRPYNFTFLLSIREHWEHTLQTVNHGTEGNHQVTTRVVTWW